MDYLLIAKQRVTLAFSQNSLKIKHTAREIYIFFDMLVLLCFNVECILTNLPKDIYTG